MEKENIEGQEIKKENKKFIIKFVIFLIILTMLTAIAVYFTIKDLNKEEQEPIIEKEEIEIKKEAEDSKFAIKSYTETYNENSLKIINYYDINGKTTTENTDMNSPYINYIQIYGLKKANIQNKINERLKEEAYKFKGNEPIYTYVTGNFSNILSVQIWSNKSQLTTINVDLSTGEDIPFEKVFISSASINSMLAEGLYETLAWNDAVQVMDEDENMDMTKVDTSQYEDKFLKLIHNYNNQKDSIKYSIYPSEIVINEIIDKEIMEYEQVPPAISINLVKHINEVAIYKRYLTSESIFEDPSVGLKNIIVLTNPKDAGNVIEYGKIANNVFVEEVLVNDIQEDKNGVCKKYIENLVKEQKDKLINQTQNKGIIYQREHYANYDSRNKFYIINSTVYQAMCSISYFENEFYKDYINLKQIPRVQAGIGGFDEYNKKNFPNLEISNIKYETYYISETGEFLGNTEAEARKKITPEQENNKVVQNNNKPEQNITQEQPKEEVNETVVEEKPNNAEINNEEKPKEEETNNQELGE